MCLLRGTDWAFIYNSGLSVLLEALTRLYLVLYLAAVYIFLDNAIFFFVASVFF